MKAIKERAEKALESYDWTIYYHCSELTEDSFKEGYIQGATEQKEIDDTECGKELLYVVNKTTERVRKEVVDKACEWIEKEAWMDCTEYRFDIDDFRKALEG